MVNRHATRYNTGIMGSRATRDQTGGARDLVVAALARRG